MKIGIGVCEEINGVCSTMGCFKAYNKKEKHFQVYRDMETELMAFFTCDICSSGGLDNISKIASKLKESQVDIVHLGVCAVKCKANRLDEIREVFSLNDIEIIEGTH